MTFVIIGEQDPKPVCIQRSKLSQNQVYPHSDIPVGAYS
jgi:hypothetical protein